MENKQTQQEQKPQDSLDDISAVIMGFTASYDAIQEKREALVTKMEDIVNAITIAADERASTILAKVAVIKTYSDILKDSEGNAKDRTTVALKKKDTESNTNQSEIVVQLLAQYDGKRPMIFSETPINLDAENVKLDQAFAEAAISIPETELKRDNKDFSEGGTIITDTTHFVRDDKNK